MFSDLFVDDFGFRFGLDAADDEAGFLRDFELDLELRLLDEAEMVSLSVGSLNRFVDDSLREICPPELPTLSDEFSADVLLLGLGVCILAEISLVFLRGVEDFCFLAS